MRQYPEIPTDTIRNIGGKSYHVRRLGFYSDVQEEVLQEISDTPTKKLIIVDADGVELKSRTVIKDVEPKDYVKAVEEMEAEIKAESP